MSTQVLEELWKSIPEFSNYDISSLGNVFNHRTNSIMRTSLTNYGHVKITLVDYRGRRLTRSVARLVAEAFCKAPNLLCDNVVILDGDFSHVAASNLVWRPRGFAWEYTHQLKTRQPPYFQNLPVVNVVENIEYRSIVEAGMYEGLLFKDIWRSTYTQHKVFPTGSIFEVVELEQFD